MFPAGGHFTSWLNISREGRNSSVADAGTGLSYPSFVIEEAIHPALGRTNIK